MANGIIQALQPTTAVLPLQQIQQRPLPIEEQILAQAVQGQSSGGRINPQPIPQSIPQHQDSAFNRLLEDPRVQQALIGFGQGVLQSGQDRRPSFGQSVLAGLVGGGQAYAQESQRLTAAERAEKQFQQQQRLAEAQIGLKETELELLPEQRQLDLQKAERQARLQEAQIGLAQEKLELAPVQAELARAQAAQASSEAELFKQQAAQLSASNPTLPRAVSGLSSEGRKEYQKLRGKNVAEKVDSYGSQVSKIPALVDTVENLRAAATEATYTQAGKLRDLALKELGLPATRGAIARADFISTVDNQILPLLRDTFGAAFTEKEGQSLKQTLGDPDSSPQEKMTVLDNFINQKIKNVESLGNELGIPVPESIKNITGKLETTIPKPKDVDLIFNPATGEFE